MSIPPLRENGELPPGEHQASVDQVEQVFGCSTERRKSLMQGLRDAISNLASSGVRKLWINGSFVTDKDEPNDIDGCWEYTPLVDTEILDPVFLRSRKDMRAKYGLDFFISNLAEAESGLPFPEFFQVNRDGEPKGIVVVNLRDPR